MVKDHGRKQALEMIDLYHKLKTEPQGDDIIVRSNLEPFRVVKPQQTMSKETIYKEDAIKALRSTVAQYVPFLNGINETLPIECETALRAVPSATRTCGEWIAKTENHHSHWTCSECGAWALLEYNEQQHLSKYCPDCGALMFNADNALNALKGED